MDNYINISDDAQSLLIEIAKNKNDAPVLTVCQVEELGELAGLHENNVYPIAHELERAGIVKISNSGKDLFLDLMHINEFRRQFHSSIN